MKNNLITLDKYSKNFYLPVGRSSTFARSFSSIPGIPASPSRLTGSAQITKDITLYFSLHKLKMFWRNVTISFSSNKLPWLNVFIPYFGHSPKAKVTIFSPLSKNPKLKQYRWLIITELKSNNTLYDWKCSSQNHKRISINTKQNSNNTFPMWNMIAWGFFVSICSILRYFWNIFR